MMNLKKNIVNVHFVIQKLEETKSTKSKCCDRPTLINDSHVVCTNCGKVNSYLAANEFVDSMKIDIELGVIGA